MRRKETLMYEVVFEDNYNCTLWVKNAIESAIQQADSWGHTHISTGHLLLGLTMIQSPLLEFFEEQIGENPQDRIKFALTELFGSSASKPETLSFTSGSITAFELARKKATDLNFDRTDLHHLLFGLIKENGDATLVLECLEINAGQFLNEIVSHFLYENPPIRPRRKRTHEYITFVGTGADNGVETWEEWINWRHRHSGYEVLSVTMTILLRPPD